ncbi:MAG TPA: methionine--tRNA ligase [Candidatus Baltobacteraceae bacterium]|nr:methionine--tRNA ligase [Candidatus Baltobacteraceae bacterium]
MPRPFYVTTPIYYISGNPHIGHAYTTIVADVLARSARAGGSAYFLTGTDEHGQKVADAAAAAGKSPQQWCDDLIPRWQSLFAQYDVKYDDFIRTTQERHTSVVQGIFEKLRANGDIYLGKYEGWYCVHDETFWLESKLVDGKCPTCGRAVQWLSEDDWFFRLSKYNDRLKQYFLDHPDWVRPRAVYNEMMALLDEGLEDLSISRTNLEWGIPVPNADKGVIYVWFDALINYVSALGWPDGEKFKQFWPASVQLIGKEIARFHTLIWPAILWGIGEQAPDMVFAHGWITVEGQKIGKSLGNAVDPFALAERFGADAMRYFLLREAPFGSDFSYSELKIVQRYNSDLGNDLGNLLRRSLAMLEKYRNGLVPQAPDDTAFGQQFSDLPNRVHGLIFDLQFRDALEAIWELIGALNRAIDERKPWVLFKEGRAVELDALLYDLCEGLRWIAILIAPFMPGRAETIREQLGLQEALEQPWAQLQWGGIAAGTQTAPGDALFPRIETAATT